MITFLFGWMLEHLLLSGVIALLSGIGIAGGVRAVRRHQKKRDRERSAEIKRSRKVDATAKATKPKTARQILREQRSKQPLGVVRRKRAPDDPRFVRRTLRRLKTRQTNKKATDTIDRPKELLTTKIADKASVLTGGQPRSEKRPMWFKYTCNATNDSNDMKCNNAQHPPGSGSCWIPSHQAQVRSGKQT